MPYLFYTDFSYYVLVLPFFLLALYAQFRVKSTFNKFSSVSSRNGLTGADVARQLLSLNGITDVAVNHIPGSLSDHYDPRKRVLNLSDSVYSSKSLAAISVAAHETGHAVQHHNSYSPLALRNSIFPVVHLSSNLAMPLIIIGILLSSYGSGSSFGLTLVNIGIILFSCVVFFQLITLPVEFNASKQAIAMLQSNNILMSDEISPAKKVLSAAALTYVASAAVALANLIRFILIANRRN